MTLSESASLTPEQLRVAVAERLGKCTHGPELWSHEGTDGDMDLVCTVCKRARADLRYPDYPNDLNACHQFEATLNEQQQADYVDWFFHNLPELENQGPNPDEEGDIMCVGLWQLVNATPDQRCRAFLAVTSAVTENRNE